MSNESKVVQQKDVESWSIEKIIPYEKNAKKHDPKEIDALAESIRKFGFRGYVRVDKNGVLIGGHKRRLAALQLGYKYLPVIVDDHLTEEEVKAARLAENRVHGSNYDEMLIKEELAELADLDFDLSGMGFDERELEFLTENLDDMNVDAVIDDLDAEVTEQTERVEQKVEEVSESKVSIGEALGFKQVTVNQARTIGKFMGKLEEETNQEGVEAFMEFVSTLVE